MESLHYEPNKTIGENHIENGSGLEVTMDFEELW